MVTFYDAFTNTFPVVIDHKEYSCVIIITQSEERRKKRPDPNAKSIVTNALPLISRNSFSPTSCQRTTRHSKDYATS